MSIKHPFDEWEVYSPGLWENDQGPIGWWAVANSDGIVAYFSNEADAWKYFLLKASEYMTDEETQIQKESL